MGARYQPYPEYKDSGVEWLGEIPAHWDIKKLKFLAKNKPSNVDKKAKEGELPVSLCNYTDVYYNDTIDSSMDFMLATATRDQVDNFCLKSGDTIITKDSEDPNDIAVPAFVCEDMDNVVCGYHLSIVRPENKLYGKYIKRVFETHYARSYFATRSNGLTRYGLGVYALDNASYPQPSESEALKIADFLDHETAKIDILIDKQQQLIKLLKEKRQAVISHAVTKGLNPDVPMKDSGVEWLGEVPEHWKVVHLKYLVLDLAGIQMGPFGGMLKDLEYNDTGYKLYGQENTISGDFSKGSRWLTKTKYEELFHYKLEVGDIVLTRKGSLGKARQVIELEMPGIIDSDTIRIRVNHDLLDSHYLSLLMHEAYYIAEQITRIQRGSVLPGLNTETIANLRILLPSLDEQKALTTKVKHYIEFYDVAVGKCLEKCELLQERRAALISAAVTGKIDVRKVALLA